MSVLFVKRISVSSSPDERRLHGGQSDTGAKLVPIFVMREQSRCLAFCSLGTELSDEHIQRVIALLCKDLVQELERRGVGARRLDLVFMRVDNIAQAVRVGTSGPTNPVHLAKLLGERLVLVDPGFGIEEATLTASWIEAVTEKQIVGAHVARPGDDGDVSDLVDKLRVKLGAERVSRLVPHESDIPERVARRVPAMANTNGATWPNDLPSFAASDAAGTGQCDCRNPRCTTPLLCLAKNASQHRQDGWA